MSFWGDLLCEYFRMIICASLSEASIIVRILFHGSLSFFFPHTSIALLTFVNLFCSHLPRLLLTDGSKNANFPASAFGLCSVEVQLRQRQQKLCERENVSRSALLHRSLEAFFKSYLSDFVP
jgi:hypothetical protein